MSDFFAYNYLPVDDSTQDTPKTYDQPSTDMLSDAPTYVAPTPGYNGANAAHIAGNDYIVTPGNYSALARLYIQNRINNGDMSYNDKTYDGQQRIIAVINAYKILAGMPTTYQNELGINPVIETSNAVLSNPVIQTVDSLSDAGSRVFGGINSAVQGALNTSAQLGDFTKALGNIFSSAGGLLVVVGIGALIYYKVFK